MASCRDGDGLVLSDEQDDGGRVGAHCSGKSHGFWGRDERESAPRQAWLRTTDTISTDRRGWASQGYKPTLLSWQRCTAAPGRVRRGDFPALVLIRQLRVGGEGCRS